LRFRVWKRPIWDGFYSNIIALIWRHISFAVDAAIGEIPPESLGFGDKSTPTRLQKE
jgi:hypothetical protein